MRLRDLAIEAGRNVRSGTARAFAVGLTLGLVGTVLIALDASAVISLRDEVARFRASGATVITVQADAGVNGAMCRALAEAPTVAASGAIRAAGQATPVALPDTSLDAFEVTPGFAALLGVRGSGVAVSRQAADALGVETGGVLQLQTGAVEIGAVFDYPNDGRRAGFGYSVLFASPSTGVFDECWVDAWPPSPEAVALASTAVDVGYDDTQVPVAVAQLNASLGRSLQAEAEFDARPTRFAGLLAFAVALVVGLLATWMRRVELGTMLHFGIRHREVALMVAMEAAVAALIAVVLQSPVAAWFIARSLAEGAASSIWLAALVAIPSGIGIVLGSVLGALLVRERDLFRHFRDR